jgi:subtilisin family serine protease
VSFFQRFAPFACALSLLALAACKGGGTSGPNIPPGPISPCALTPGKTGSTATSPPCPQGTVAPSTYTADSNPQGMTVSLNGAAQGVTPLVLNMPFSATPYAITFSPAASSGIAPYTYTVQQNGDGPHTLYFNAPAATQGQLTNVSVTSVRRRLEKIPSPGKVRTRSVDTAGSTSVIPGRLAVYYSANAFGSTAALENFEKSFGITSAYTLGPTVANKITRIITTPAGKSDAQLSAGLRQTGRVIDVLPVHYRYLLTSIAKSPNDYHFNLQWDMQRIRMPGAWGYTYGSLTIPVAVIDTGYDPQNTDLAKKVVYSESIDQGVVTFGQAVDRFGHGTNVSGIAGAVTDNDFGFAGVGWNTPLMEFKVFFPDPSAANGYAEPLAESPDIAQGIYDAVAHGARVISMSLGGRGADSFDAVERDAVEFAIASNVTVVAAAGNEAAPLLDYPAGLSGVISVGATSLDDGDPGGDGTPAYSQSYPDTIASYSNYGPSLSLVAPGGDPTTLDQTSTNPDLNHWITNLWTTQNPNPALQCPNTGDCYLEVAGTSQATPHVSGTVALMLTVNSALTPSQVAAILEGTADDIGDSREGHGRLDSYRAVAAAYSDPNPPYAPQKPNFLAFAYTPSNASSPQIIDTSFPRGVTVASNGAFLIPDIPANATGYKIGVWFNANGRGVAGPGDYFASTPLCTANIPCTGATSLTAHPISTGFVFN